MKSFITALAIVLSSITLVPTVGLAQRLSYPGVLPTPLRSMPQRPEVTSQSTEENTKLLNDWTVAALIQRLCDNNHTVRQAAILALEAMGPAAKPAIPALAEELADPDRVIRVDAGRTLAQLGLDSVPSLIHMLHHPDPSVRVLAARTITQIQQPANDAVPALTMALRDEERSVRQAAIYALERIGPASKPAIPYLADLFHDADAYIRADAARTMIGLGTDSIPSLILLLCDENPVVRTLAAVTLRELNSDAATGRNQGSS